MDDVIYRDFEGSHVSDQNILLVPADYFIYCVHKGLVWTTTTTMKIKESRLAGQLWLHMLHHLSRYLQYVANCTVYLFNFCTIAAPKIEGTYPTQMKPVFVTTHDQLFQFRADVLKFYNHQQPC